MNIVYISYWGINEGLTESTVFPNLSILNQDPRVKKVFLFTFERGSYSYDAKFEKVNHIAISESKRMFGAEKFFSFFSGWKKIKEVIKAEKIDLVIGRSIFAGILAYHINKKYLIPFVVESYEPHADYMEESEVWKKGSLKSRILRKYDESVQHYADYLITVSNNYRNELITKNQVDEARLKVVPCTVDVEKFSFVEEERIRIRKRLGVSANAIVGIYVGKFGGIYLDVKAMELFREFQCQLGGDFFLIILTPEDAQVIKKSLKSVDFEVDKSFVSKVKHEEVSSYLSAADFAFSTIKPAPSRKFCSPIKDGEYWANGLPLLITKGVGDDDQIVLDYSIGEVWNVEMEKKQVVVERFLSKIKASNYSIDRRQGAISNVAKLYRDLQINKRVYDDILSKYV